MPFQAQLARINTYRREFILVLGEARSRLPAMVGLMLFAATLELIGVGLIAPLVGIISFGDGRPLAPAFANQPRLLFLVLGLTLVSVYIIKGFVSYAVNRRIIAFGEQHRAHLIRRLMGAYQSRDWGFHLRHGTAALVNIILWHTSNYNAYTLIGALRLATDVLVLLFLVLLLATRNFSAVVVLLALFGAAFLLVYNRLRQRLQNAQQELATANAQIISGVTQAIGGFREIRVLGTENHFLEQVTHAATLVRDANSEFGALVQVPRYVVEAVTVTFIVLLAGIQFAIEGSASSVIPVVSTFAVAGVRLMPAVTSIISSINGLRSSRFALHELAEEISVISDPAPTSQPAAAPLLERHGGRSTLEDFRELALKDVWVSYQGESSPALEALNLFIRRGESVGVMGPSGAGKSTLADTILGFLAPQAGSVELNGRNIFSDLPGWHAICAYIPQAPYILDDTIRRNITFGVRSDVRDDEKLARAVTFARLDDVVKGLPSGLETIVGERGLRLSGGQRQRVAIARALYHDRDFIILDEATAALDAETEREVVEAIRSLHGIKTLLIIAHRESTLIGCDRIIRLQRGRIVDHV